MLRWSDFQELSYGTRDENALSYYQENYFIPGLSLLCGILTRGQNIKEPQKYGHAF